jgi:hypothetical protein
MDKKIRTRDEHPGSATLNKVNFRNTFKERLGQVQNGGVANLHSDPELLAGFETEPCTKKRTHSLKNSVADPGHP